MAHTLATTLTDNFTVGISAARRSRFAKNCMFVSMVKGLLYFLVASIISAAFTGCTPATADRSAGYFHKDLSEQMDALSIAQGAIGDAIRKNNLEDADWAYNLLDSISDVMKKHVNEHHNLSHTWDYYHRNKMKAPMQKIKEGINKKDTAMAYSGYKLLVIKCNSCHNDNGVEERAHEF